MALIARTSLNRLTKLRSAAKLGERYYVFRSEAYIVLGSALR